MNTDGKSLKCPSDANPSAPVTIPKKTTIRHATIPTIVVISKTATTLILFFIYIISI